MCSVLSPACRFFPRAVFAIHVFGLSDDPDGVDGGDGDDGDAYDDDGFDDDADAICTALYATRLMRSPAPALQPSDCD